MEEDKNKLHEFIVDGKVASPVVEESVKNFLIDIDGTVTEDVPNEDPERMKLVLPYPDALASSNKWFDDGHVITFFTSRTEETRKITEHWLNKHGFKYHGLLMGKPRGGNYHWIDNHIVKATRFHGKFPPNFKIESSDIEVFDA
ncbi:MAG: hypothetical protein ACI8ZN_001371 [Bacteroidia bacterium]